MNQPVLILLATMFGMMFLVGGVYVVNGLREIEADKSADTNRAPEPATTSPSSTLEPVSVARVAGATKKTKPFESDDDYWHYHHHATPVSLDLNDPNYFFDH